MMFQQRHYEAIARMMQDAMPEFHWDANKRTQWEVIRSRMADMFAQDNPRFMRDRFIGACERGANVRAKSHPKVGA